MNNKTPQPSHPQLKPVCKIITQLLLRHSIPTHAKRLALNFKSSQFYTKKQGAQSVEIQIERPTSYADWEILLVVEFKYPTQESERLDLFQYFDFYHGLFYLPNAECLELTDQKAQAQLKSWIKSFLTHTNQGSFDIQIVTLVKSI
ncbi:DUF2787 family protein [Vibrio alginolyticus]|uniref:DUF2787 family protein n=1 Tax=Vibrio alginolyticus TaxID=663 RepID=UPI003D7C61B2